MYVGSPDLIIDINHNQKQREGKRESQNGRNSRWFLHDSLNATVRGKMPQVQTSDRRVFEYSASNSGLVIVMRLLTSLRSGFLWRAAAAHTRTWQTCLSAQPRALLTSGHPRYPEAPFPLSGDSNVSRSWPEIQGVHLLFCASK